MRYYLKFKDIILADIDFDGFSFKILSRNIHNNILWMLNGDISLNKWISNRPTQISRHNSIELFKLAGIRTDVDFVNITNCLSLQDSLWLTRDKNKPWKSVSLFSNPFNKVFTDVAKSSYGFTGKVIRTPSPELTVGGSSLKWYKRINNNIYLFKSFGGMNELESSGSYAEFFASQLCKYLNVYGYVNYDLSKVNDKVCSVSECFTSEYISSVYVGDLCDNANHLDEHINFYGGIHRKNFRDMMVVDCLLFNVDRHDENISLLYDNSFNVIGLAPMYDFDHSLFYDLSLVNRDYEYIIDGLRRYVPRTYNNHTFLDQFKLCIDECMYKKLVNAYRDFEFVNSKKYPVNKDRLNMINKVFRWNLKRLLEGV